MRTLRPLSGGNLAMHRRKGPILGLHPLCPQSFLREITALQTYRIGNAGILPMKSESCMARKGNIGGSMKTFVFFLSCVRIHSKSMKKKKNMKKPNTETPIVSEKRSRQPIRSMESNLEMFLTKTPMYKRKKTAEEKQKSRIVRIYEFPPEEDTAS